MCRGWWSMMGAHSGSRIVGCLGQKQHHGRRRGKRREPDRRKKQIRAKAKTTFRLGAKKREKERGQGRHKKKRSITNNQSNNLYRSDESGLQGWARRGQLLTTSNRAGADHRNPGLARSVALTRCEFIGADSAQESHDRVRLRPASAVLQQVEMGRLYWLVLVGCWR